MPDFFPALALEAEKLAKNMMLSSAAHQRYWKTEKIWRYRFYQRGDSAHMIDWRQSARSEKLLTREAEPTRFRPVLAWTPLSRQDDDATRHALLLLLALGRMLIKAERTVGWLGQDVRQTRTTSLFQNIVADALSLPSACAAPPEAPSLHFATLVLAGDMAAAPSEWLASIRSHGGRGNKGVLLDFSSTDLSPIHACAKNMGWPVIKTSPSCAPETVLLHLFEESLKSST